jgi:photosystem II stability/assembly factor-like uncharacterized protein
VRAKPPWARWMEATLVFLRGGRACVWIALAPLALTAACREPTTPSRCADLPSVQGWTSLGPAGKWITSVALTPVGLLVGTQSDGVFRYDSCRGDWAYSGLAGRDITSITALLPPANRLLVTAIPLFPDTISSVLYASDDGGRTWYPRDGGLSAQRGYYGYAVSLAFDSSNANRLFLGLPAAVMRSLDAGTTWTTAFGDSLGPGGLVWCLAVSPSSGRVWAAGERGGQFPFVWRSDDGGTTWQQFGPTPYQNDFVLAIAQDPTAKDRLYAGMASGLRETEDAGVTWRLVLSPHLPGPVTGLAVLGDNLVVVSDELVPNSAPTRTVLGLYVTADRGATWDTVPVPPDAWGAIRVAISASRVAFIGTRSGVWSVPLP